MTGIKTGILGLLVLAALAAAGYRSDHQVVCHYSPYAFACTDGTYIEFNQRSVLINESIRENLTDYIEPAPADVTERKQP